MANLFLEQVGHLTEAHFLLLFWCAQAEDRGIPYNMTNVFDDLKSAGITRTKQNAMASVVALEALRFVAVREEGNRKNVYITPHGARALETLARDGTYTARKSTFLEGR